MAMFGGIYVAGKEGISLYRYEKISKTGCKAMKGLLVLSMWGGFL